MLLTWGIPTALLVAHLFIMVTNPADTTAPGALGTAIAISLLILLPIAIFRLRRVQSILAHGRIVEGEIIDFAFGTTSGRVIWQYVYQNKMYQSKARVSGAVGQATWMQIRYKIAVIVHDKQPQHSIIRDLYVKGTPTGIP